MDEERDQGQDVDSMQVMRRADLLPEEKAAGSADRTMQAAEILRDSERRASDSIRVLGDAEQRATSVEHRTSEEATDPVPDREARSQA